MKIDANKLGISLVHDDGTIEFTLPWTGILSIGVWRTAHLELDGKLTRKLVIVPQFDTQDFREWYVWEESNEWGQWVDAFEQFITDFDPHKLESVLHDTENEDTEYSCLFLANSPSRRETSEITNELEAWFDAEYSTRSQRPESEESRHDEMFFHVYDLLAEVGNGVSNNISAIVQATIGRRPKNH